MFSCIISPLARSFSFYWRKSDPCRDHLDCPEKRSLLSEAATHPSVVLDPHDKPNIFSWIIFLFAKVFTSLWRKSDPHQDHSDCPEKRPLLSEGIWFYEPATHPPVVFDPHDKPNMFSCIIFPFAKVFSFLWRKIDPRRDHSDCPEKRPLLSEGIWFYGRAMSTSSKVSMAGTQPSQHTGWYDHLIHTFRSKKRDPALLLQPETRPISQEQLVNEVKAIYAGLVMVEMKCVEIDSQLDQNQIEGRQIKLSNEQWQALIALHRTLLHEHHDFFLASQHPSASPALRRLEARYISLVGVNEAPPGGFFGPYARFYSYRVQYDGFIKRDRSCL
jgi:hypothetical protein